MTSIKENQGKPLPPELRARLAYLAARAWAQELSDPEIALAYVNGEFDQELLSDASLPEEPGLERLYAAALAIADERREKLKQLKRALLDKDKDTSLQIAAELCGVSYEEGHRTHPRIN